MSEADPVANLGKLIADLRRAIDIDLRVCLPGRIVLFDATKQTATVSPDLLGVENRGDVDIPFAPSGFKNVPVFIYGSASAYMSTPLPPGTTGLIMFSDRALEKWKVQGKPIDPGLNRFHDLSDGIFLPGVRAVAGKIGTPIDTTAAVLEHAVSVKLGRGAVDFVALAAKVLTELTKIKTSFDLHTHLYAPGPGGLVPTAIPVPLLTAPSSVAATKAKAE